MSKIPPAEAPACRACGSPCRHLWIGPLLDLDVRYDECPQCGYVQTEQPFWLERAYAKSVNDSDTGLLARNLLNVQIVLSTLYALKALHGRVVDYAGGYGVLTRLLRDYGVDAYWSDRYCENLLARGFEHTGDQAQLLTAFEAFEHFVDPGAELDKMFAIAPNVLLSTSILPVSTPRSEDWWYYGREHGQHIGFFRVQTLRALANSRGAHLVSDGHTYHLISKRPIDSRVWRLHVRMRRLFRILVRRRLKSKTWEDHLRAAKR